MTIDQTLASTETLAQKWEGLGMVGGTGSTDPNHLLILLGARSKSGKSYLMQSNPHAFIFNFDGNPIVYDGGGEHTPSTRAAMWPVSHDGKQMGPNGKSIPQGKLYEEALKVKAKLLALAAQDKDRPKMIVLDTITTMRRAVQDWVPGQMGKSSFEACGLAGHAKVNEAIVRFGLDLHAAGYGVTWCAHLRHPEVPVGDQVVKDTSAFEVDVTDGLWRGLQAHPDCIMRLDRSTVSELDKTVKPPKMKKEQVVKVFIEDPNTQFSSRFSFLPSEFKVPSKDPWQAFEALFTHKE
jgi:hypothetical protein